MLSSDTETNFVLYINEVTAGLGNVVLRIIVTLDHTKVIAYGGNQIRSAIGTGDTPKLAAIAAYRKLGLRLPTYAMDRSEDYLMLYAARTHDRRSELVCSFVPHDNNNIDIKE